MRPAALRDATRPKLIAAVVGVAVIVLVSVIILVVTSGQDGQAADPDPHATGPISTPSATAAPSAAPTMPPEHREDLPANDTQRTQIQLANDYIDAFLAAGSTEARKTALQGLATPQNLVDIAEIDQSRVPAATRVPNRDAALDPSAGTATRAYAHVQLTDDSWWGMWLVQDANAPRGWAVASLEKFGH
ncbi:hypothetical protein [Granulicoccus phenolivorans]|uniref:hypothetical protein n=1 Tax=Granulicoccus phenolivorans TaxID=266854 RepID=UPI000410E776|nr:hypothetical protein [Granulicoccus phenolivorans]